MARHSTPGWFFRGLSGVLLLSCLRAPWAWSEEGIAPNHPAPGFTRQALDGSRFSLAHVRGKVVLLTFWASWCGPCLAEMPTFASWQKTCSPQGFQVVGVSMDDERRDAVSAYRRYRLNYPVVMGDAKLGERYGGVLGLPLTYLIDEHGIIRYRHQGVADLHLMEIELKELMTHRSPSH